MPERYKQFGPGRSFILMDRELIHTTDGSATIYVPSLQVTYHSRNGAIRESLHVFIESGLHYWLANNPHATGCRIFEMGFGTGLNALLTLINLEASQKETAYTAIDVDPLEPGMVNALNYCNQLNRPEMQEMFRQLHNSAWETEVAITSFFRLQKCKTALQHFFHQTTFDIIYYDAFAPNVQPELWTEAIFHQLHLMLRPGGLLVTYCSKGAVQRALKAAGFVVEKLPGPPGKREMVRGCRTDEQGTRNIER